MGGFGGISELWWDSSLTGNTAKGKEQREQKQAPEPNCATANGVAQRASSIMTQSLLNEMAGDGTEHTHQEHTNTPQQCTMRKTHVAETREAEEERERNEGGCASGWLKSLLCYVKRWSMQKEKSYFFILLFTEGYGIF